MTPYVSRSGLAAVVSALLLSVMAYLPVVVSGHLTRDSGVFLYTGMVISREGMPYIDSWDHKGPLLAVIEAMAWRLAGGVVGAPILEGIVFFVGLAISGIIWSRFAGRAAAPAVVLAGVTYLGMFEGGNFTETWLFPFQLVSYSAAVGVAFRWGRDASGRAMALLGAVVGLALSMGLFTRMNNAVGIFLLAVLGAFYFRRRLIFAFACAGVVGVIGVGLVFWLLRGDALSAGLDQYVRYNLLYSGGSTLGDRLGSLAALSQLLVSSAVVAAALVVIGARVMIKAKADGTGQTATLALTAMLAVGGVDALSQMTSGRDYPHYLVVAIAGFTVATIVGWSQLKPSMKERWLLGGTRRPRAQLVVAGVVLVSLVIAPSSAAALDWIRTTMGSGVFVAGSYQAQIVNRVLEETAPDDRVLVHGAETWILASARRLSPTSITYSLPVEQGYGGLPAQYLADIRSSPPALIVESPTSCGISSECPPQRDHFAGMAPWIVSSYELEGDVAGFRFWRRNE